MLILFYLDMCGIIGVIGGESIVSELYGGLRTIQHRGQDSAGIITFNGNKFHRKRGLGLLTDVFGRSKDSEVVFEYLNAENTYAGIGHVRYPTIGKANNIEDVQPFDNSCMAITHNGHIVNYLDLKEELKRNNYYLKSKSDVEVILGLLTLDLQKKKDFDEEDIFSSVKNIMGNVKGFYSVAAIIPRFGLLAFRDSHAGRPLVYGYREEDSSYMVASETIALDKNNYSTIDDVVGGEAILISPSGTIIKSQLVSSAIANCMFEWVYFAGQ